MLVGVRCSSVCSAAVATDTPTDWGSPASAAEEVFEAVAADLVVKQCQMGEFFVAEIATVTVLGGLKPCVELDPVLEGV